MEQEPRHSLTTWSSLKGKGRRDAGERERREAEKGERERKGQRERGSRGERRRPRGGARLKGEACTCVLSPLRSPVMHDVTMMWPRYTGPFELPK